ncbi:MAG: DUF502 domain-containing protein [Candidatus Aminicenantes bacterium]|nr:DUF502 domain-containing protein [Candidatus Aminicenantes bacterium]
MKGIFRHLKTYIFRGFLALLPLALSFFVLRFLYITVDQRIARLFERWVGFSIPGFGLLLVLFVLYLLGLVASNWTGRQALSFLDKTSSHIPLIKTIYLLGKQLGAAFSAPEKKGLKRVVLVEHFRPGVWSIGFVMGSVFDEKSGEKMLRLFVPTAPNPTSGFMLIVAESKVKDVDWSVSEAMNTVISGGLIGPDTIKDKLPGSNPP